jgi:hypothetical protein
VLVKRFGLTAFGVFALGFVLVSALGILVPVGLPAYLPRAARSHPELCSASLIIQVMLLPASIVGVWWYSNLVARTASELTVIAVISISGYFLGVSATGLMLCVMKRSYHQALVATAIEAIAIVISATMARSPEQVALLLLGARLVGSLAIWSSLSYRTCAPCEIVRTVRLGVQYLVPDILSTLAEQSGPLVLQMYSSRAELGLFRLCQQMLNATETPGWSYVLSHYPDMVDVGQAHWTLLKQQMKRLGLIAAVLCALGSWAAAEPVYHISVLAPMMLVVSLCVLPRYKTYLLDQRLRAGGGIAISSWLAACKLMVFSGAFLLLVPRFHAWGAIMAVTSISILFETFYRRSFQSWSGMTRVPTVGIEPSIET